MAAPAQDAAGRGGPGGERVAWWLFAPAAAWVGLRWLLTWAEDRAPLPPAWALAPFAGTQDPWAGLRPAGIALIVAGALALLAWRWTRRHGPQAVLRAAAALWLLLWAAACAAQIVGFFNLRGLQPQPPLAAELLGVRERPPSLRSLGGTLWVLRIDGDAAAQQVLVQDAAAAQVPLHARLALQTARGRWYGRYVRGWDMLAPPNRLP